MKLKDARHLSPDAQEILRYRVVNAVTNGMSKPEATKVFSVSRTAVRHWTKVANEQGARCSSVAVEEAGRRRSSRLAPHQAVTTVRLITKKCLDQLSLPFALWTRESVR